MALSRISLEFVNVYNTGKVSVCLNGVLWFGDRVKQIVAIKSMTVYINGHLDVSCDIGIDTVMKV